MSTFLFTFTFIWRHCKSIQRPVFILSRIKALIMQSISFSVNETDNKKKKRDKLKTIILSQKTEARDSQDCLSLYGGTRKICVFYELSRWNEIICSAEIICRSQNSSIQMLMIKTLFFCPTETTYNCRFLLPFSSTSNFFGTILDVNFFRRILFRLFTQ